MPRCGGPWSPFRAPQLSPARQVASWPGGALFLGRAKAPRARALNSRSPRQHQQGLRSAPMRVLASAGHAPVRPGVRESPTSKRRPLLPAWASTFLTKWTRHRCQVACSTLATAAFSPSWASEITSLTPRRPRRASFLRKSVQKVSASEGPTPMPSTSRRPSALAPTATMTATETIRPAWRCFRYVASIQR
jgi:hypothetical protein